jgi:hypothetical protein
MRAFLLPTATCKFCNIDEIEKINVVSITALHCGRLLGPNKVRRKGVPNTGSHVSRGPAFLYDVIGRKTLMSPKTKGYNHFEPSVV